MRIMALTGQIERPRYLTAEKLGKRMATKAISEQAMDRV